MEDLLANPRVRQNMIFAGVFWLLVLTVAVIMIYKRNQKSKESSFLSIDGSYYMVPQWQDSWPLN